MPDVSERTALTTSEMLALPTPNGSTILQCFQAALLATFSSADVVGYSAVYDVQESLVLAGIVNGAVNSYGQVTYIDRSAYDAAIADLIANLGPR
jgi:hypothetical protein